MKVGVVDIGTNSMRLLITGPEGEVGRWVEVTGLGRGVDSSHRLDGSAIDRTIAVFESFGRLLEVHGVEIRKAIATSASRDASNREEFFDRAETALGVRPTVISGTSEARYAFRGAVGEGVDNNVLVSDIGGGSTEFVTSHESLSIDIGSVRLTDRLLEQRPVSMARVRDARMHVATLMGRVSFHPARVIGVAGTWTSLSAMAMGLTEYDRDFVDGSFVDRARLSHLIDDLAAKSLVEIEEIPSLDPKRAPVILAGAIVAESVLLQLGLDQAEVSERDTLDGVAAELLALA